MEKHLADVKPESYLHLAGRDVKNLGELLHALEEVDDKTFSTHAGDIYKWIKAAVGDETLARKIRKLKFRTNAIKMARERISFLKNIEYGLDEKEIVKKLKLYVNEVRLVLDKNVCCKCVVCSAICPKEAIKIEENIEITDDCVLCGLCAPFCPVGAIRFFIDGEEKNLLMEYKGIPQLPDFIDIDGHRVRRLFTGNIRIDESKCPDDCEECVSACPTGAIERDGKAVRVDEDKCILCGACQTVCPEDAVTIRRNRIIHGEGFSTAWDKALEKLADYNKVVLAHHDSAERRLVRLVEESGLKKWLK